MTSPYLKSMQLKKLMAWNQTEQAIPLLTLAELLHTQAQITPHAIALIDADQSLTYFELHQQANQWAHYLQEFGIERNKLVAVYLPRSIELVILLVAIIKAGGAYLPINCNLPIGRVRKILKDSQPSLCITSNEKIQNIKHSMLNCVINSIEYLANTAKSFPKRLLNIKNSQEDISYVIYTSGSTGEPKGVANLNQGTANTILWLQKNFPLAVGDKILQKTSIGFDLSIPEFWWPLISGASIVLASKGSEFDMALLAKCIIEQQINIIQFVPSQLAAFIQSRMLEQCRTLRMVICIGEALHNATKDAFIKASNAALYNFYGPTEASVYVSYYLCIKNTSLCATSAIVPIGKPGANTQFYVFNEKASLAKIGESGELYIAGLSLAQGYWNNEELTEEKFVMITSYQNKKIRAYKTGDLVRWLNDGNLEFIGRIDNQVKIRGYRIELSEIESIILKHPAIVQAIVRAQKLPSRVLGLVGYIVNEISCPQPKSEELQKFISHYLSDYMLPCKWIWLEKIPLTSSGKVDYKALPMPDWSQDNENSKLTVNYVQKTMIDLWEKFLRVSPLGLNANFFALGGDSILAMQIALEAKRKGLTVPPELFMLSSNLGELAAKIEENNCFLRCPEIQNAEQLNSLLSKNYPAEYEVVYSEMLPLHQGLLFQMIEHPTSEAYHIQAEIELQSTTNIDLFKKSWQFLVDNEETLRASFFLDEHHAYQYGVIKKFIPIWKEYDWSFYDNALQISKLKKLKTRDKKQSFNIKSFPLFRLYLIKLDENQYKFIFSYHHLLLDGWSLNILLTKLSTVYFSLLLNKSTFVFPSVKYDTFLNWLNKQNENNAKKHWKKYLKGFQEVTDIKYFDSKNKKITCSSAYEVKAAFPISLNELNPFLSKYQVSLNTLLTASLGILLQYLTNSEDVVIGNTISLRPIELPAIDESLGLYINTIPVRLNWKKTDAIETLLSNLHFSLLKNIQHGFYPLHKIKAESELTTSCSLFEVLLTFENYPQFYSGNIKNCSIDEQTHYKLTFIVQLDEKVTIRILSHEKYYPKSFVQKLLNYYLNVIENLLLCHGKQVLDLPILTNEDTKRLVFDFNRTQVNYPYNLRLEDIFHLCMRKYFNKTAVVDEFGSWTYSKLEQKCKEYYHFLSHFPYCPIIVIAVNRRIELAALLITVLKLGSAFLPIDPTLPKKRIEKILSLSKTKLVITENSFKNLFLEEKCAVMTIEQLNEQTLLENKPLIKKQTKSIDDAAYVIYTSGSTGDPKGVVITHKSLINRLLWMKDYLNFTSKDNVLQKTSISFDVSMWELFLPFISGGTLVFSAPGKQADMEYLVDSIYKHGITTLHFVPSFLKSFLESLQSQKHREMLKSLKSVICSGEALTAEIVNLFCEIFDKQKMYNFYGPTEATIDVTYYRCKNDNDFLDVPLGKPIANTQIYIINHEGKLLPENIAGEIAIGGIGVASGYLYNKILTNKRFAANPFIPNSRLYYSGDIGYRDAEGLIHYLGRQDSQVKIRGYRVELGEIEAKLMRNENIKKAVIIYDKISPDNDIIAFIEEHMPVENEAKRLVHYNTYLSEFLPFYMLPNSYVCVKKFPHLSNGKIDRKKLSVIIKKEPDYYIAKSHAQTKLNEIINIFEFVFQVAGLGMSDNFFTLGGHSLTALRLVALLNKNLSIRIRVSDIFSHPKIGQLTQFILEKEKNISSLILPEHYKDKSCIVPIKLIDNAPNVFLIHPICGTIYRFQALANYLENKWSVYGIQDPGLFNNDFCFSNLEGMASHYLKEIKKVQSTGVFILGGSSFGATLAIEVARQLIKEGNKVLPVILFDGWAIYPDEVHTEEYLTNYVNEQYKNLPANESQYIPKPQLAIHLQRAALLQQYSLSNKTLPEIVLFKAQELLPVLSQNDDKNNHWGRFYKNQIVKFNVFGNHDTMFLPPNIQFLSKNISNYLERNILNVQLEDAFV